MYLYVFQYNIESIYGLEFHRCLLFFLLLFVRTITIAHNSTEMNLQHMVKHRVVNKYNAKHAHKIASHSTTTKNGTAGGRERG